MKQTREEKLERMRALAEELNRASEAYYARDEELMSNYQYDRLYEELQKLEEETQLVLSGSPTMRVGYEAVEELPKERHERPMLSLRKTKDREELKSWLKDQDGLLSWKLDGLTVVLTYRDGLLEKAVTRGNGEIGEVVTGNARVFRNLPLKIDWPGEVILRGEAVISYPDFERMNREIDEAALKYKNPRNLCSGSVRQLNNAVTAARNVRFIAFSLVQAQGADFANSREQQYLFLKRLGFEVVEYRRVRQDDLLAAVEGFEKRIADYALPSDGLVLIYDDIAYGQSLGRTAKFPRDAIAFKWADEICETVLREIEWSPSRTGLINPVAIFDPVELEGTTVSRASVHNISILRGLRLGIGDHITVYKANMIIPQIAENLTGSDSVPIPERCPVCGEPTRIRQTGDVQALYCVNPQCDAKKIKSFTLFVSRDALNIEGLSEATLEKLIARGLLHEFADVFRLGTHRDEIASLDGFGEKSCANLLASIEQARETTLPRLLYGLGIAGIGLAGARAICREYGGSPDALQQADAASLSGIDGIGPVLAEAFTAYFADAENRERFARLLGELRLRPEEAQEAEGGALSGKSFVITGSLERFSNRSELKEAIERRGGRVTGSVTGKTECLINNDASSGSAKNKKAKQLGVRVVTEAQFLEEYLGGDGNAD